MAQSFVTTEGTLIIPGAYPTIKVEAAASGLATTGVLMLVGEADAGPDYSEEEDLADNTFGPDQLGDAIAKYKSGSLVDALRGAAAASNDPNIVGSFSRAILVKTNVSAKASANMVKFDASTYAALADRSYGKLGNLINYMVTTRTAEVGPTTGAFAFLPPIASTNISLRVNGGAALAATVTAQMTPTQFVTLVDALSGVDATGGVDREILGTSGTPLAGNLVVAATGNSIVVTFSVNYGAVPTAGDTLWIPSGSVIAGASNENRGAYVVTAATATTITATKLLDATGTPAQLTAPANVASVAADDNTDVMAFSPVTILNVVADPSPGLGKTLEINELTSGTGIFSTLCYTLVGSTPTAVTWISTTATPAVITSSAEYVALLTASRQVDNITEELFEGGKVALTLGYTGTTASAVITSTTMTITVVGGSGTSPAAITLADYPTIADLATYISTLTGFTAAAATGIMGQQPSTSLDQGTFTFGSTFGAKTGRIKQDAYKFFNKVNNDGVLVQVSVDGETQPGAGLPAPQALSYLSGGTKGATTDALFNSAVDALEMVRGNFLVPLFSRDASEDVADSLTDAASTYTIANIHSYSRAHVNKMSTLKRKRNRQVFVSMRDDFDTVKETAANLANYRAWLGFQDVKDISASGVVQYQPWMAAVKMAAMQAAGFYRPMVRKFVSISAAIQAAGDFNAENDSAMEDALLAGLGPIRRDETGGFYWVSDQTTYGKDSNFVYNSVQAVYTSDTLALTVAQRLERNFVGQSVADVSATLVVSALEQIMDDMFRLKLIAKSSDAPRGFKNLRVQIQGPAMLVSFEAKLATGIYYIPVSCLISQVTQSAG